MAEFNDIIHQPIRLKIMATLNTFPNGELVEYGQSILWVRPD